MKAATSRPPHDTKVEGYYKFQSRIYDATRWGFLFGRQQILNKIPDLPTNPRILEVGCGTGKNIGLMEYLFPDAKIYGIDLSRAMLQKARQKTGDTTKITLINKSYGSEQIELKPFDLILFSYSLTMAGEKTCAILQQAYEDLKPNGHIAVADFLSTPSTFFQAWMKRNHVNIDGSLLPLLNKYFIQKYSSINPAYFGLWNYFMFWGKRG